MPHFLLYTGHTAIRLTLLLTSIAITVCTVEWIYHRKIYAKGGWLEWKYLRSCKKLYRNPILLAMGLDTLFDYPAVLLLVGAELMLALLLLSETIQNQLPPLLVLGLCIMALVMHIRNHFSNNGSDQLSNIILVAASISFLPAPDHSILYLSIFFIACQSALSYFTSGILKLLTAEWRNGDHLKGIFSTGTFGHPGINRLLGGRQYMYKILSLSVISLEILLGISMLLPMSACLILLFFGMLLHASIAITMGLNNFFWTFPATYPCLYFICTKLNYVIYT